MPGARCHASQTPACSPLLHPLATRPRPPGGASSGDADGRPGTPDSPDVTSKRAFLSALTASAPTVFPFLCEVGDGGLGRALGGAGDVGVVPACAQQGLYPQVVLELVLI